MASECIINAAVVSDCTINATVASDGVKNSAGVDSEDMNCVDDDPRECDVEDGVIERVAEHLTSSLPRQGLSVEDIMSEVRLDRDRWEELAYVTSALANSISHSRDAKQKVDSNDAVLHNVRLRQLIRSERNSRICCELQLRKLSCAALEPRAGVASRMKVATNDSVQTSLGIEAAAAPPDKQSDDELQSPKIIKPRRLLGWRGSTPLCKGDISECEEDCNALVQVPMQWAKDPEGRSVIAGQDVEPCHPNMHTSETYLPPAESPADLEERLGDLLFLPDSETPVNTIHCSTGMSADECRSSILGDMLSATKITDPLPNLGNSTESTKLSARKKLFTGLDEYQEEIVLSNAALGRRASGKRPHKHAKEERSDCIAADHPFHVISGLKFVPLKRQKKASRVTSDDRVDTSPKSKPRTQSKPWAQPQPGTQPQLQPATQREPGTQPQSQPGTQPQLQPGTKLQSQPGTQSKPRPATQPQPQPGTQPQPGAHVEVEVEKRTTTELQTQPCRSGEGLVTDGGHCDMEIASVDTTEGCVREEDAAPPSTPEIKRKEILVNEENMAEAPTVSGNVRQMDIRAFQYFCESTGLELAAFRPDLSDDGQRMELLTTMWDVCTTEERLVSAAHDTLITAMTLTHASQPNCRNGKDGRICNLPLTQKLVVMRRNPRSKDNLRRSHLSERKVLQTKLRFLKKSR